MPPITVPSLTEAPTAPQKSMGSVLFDQYADPFVAWIASTFGPEINDIIDAINTITSGLDQAEPIAAYNAATTYNFPDVCAGSDGYTYRCIGVNVVGVDPVTDDGSNWVRVSVPFASEAVAIAGTETKKAVSPATALAMIRAKAMPAPPSGVDTTGNIMGFDLSKTGANEVTVSKGACLDSTLTVPLALTADTAVAVPAVANTGYHIFVVRLVADGSITVKAYTSEAAVASDGTVDKWRWVGWWKTNGSSICVDGVFRGDVFTYFKFSEATFNGSVTLTSSFAQIDASSHLPIGRVIGCQYAAQTSNSSTDQEMTLSVDGINTFMGARVQGRDKTGDNEKNAWGLFTFQSGDAPLIGNGPYVSRLSDSNAVAVKLAIHAFKVRR